MRAGWVGVAPMSGCYTDPPPGHPDASLGGQGGSLGGQDGANGGSGGPAGGAGGGTDAGGGTGDTSDAPFDAADALSDAADALSDASSGLCPGTCPAPTTGPTTGSGVCLNGECRISCNSSYPTLCESSTSCVDLNTDGKNCGKCGHDCLGGTCAGGQCQPVLIARYTGNPEIIYVGREYVYATTDIGYVGRANKDGSDLRPFAMPGFASSVFGGTLVAEDGDRVFLVRVPNGTIQLSSCLTSGCDVSAVPIGGLYTQYFAVDQVDHKIVWVDYSPARFVSGPTIGTISGVDLPGGGLSSETNGSRLLYAQGGIYFVDSDRTSIRRIPVAGGSIATVTTGTAPLVALGANSTSLFVYDGSDIGSVPLPSGDGGSPRRLVGTTLTPGVDATFAADDHSIYWVSDSVVETCEISNCISTQRLLPKSSTDNIYDVGIDDVAVYWVSRTFTGNLGACTVSKLAR
jgi:hypothetical protein